MNLLTGEWLRGLNDLLRGIPSTTALFLIILITSQIGFSVGRELNRRMEVIIRKEEGEDFRFTPTIKNFYLGLLSLGISTIFTLLVLVLFSILNIFVFPTISDYIQSPITRQKQPLMPSITARLEELPPLSGNFVFVRNGKILLAHSIQNAGTNYQTLTTQENSFSPVISRRGDWVAFLRLTTNSTDRNNVKDIISHQDDREIFSSRNHVILLKLNKGGTPKHKQLTSQPSIYMYPKFSPSGRYLAWMDWSSSEVLIYDIERGLLVLQQEINNGRMPRMDYEWDLSEQNLYVADTNGGATHLNGEVGPAGINVWRIDLATKTLSRFSKIEPFAKFPEIEFDISPDASRIAYYGRQHSKPENWNVYVSNLDGSQRESVLKGETNTNNKKIFTSKDFFWSPQGEQVAFAINKTFTDTTYVWDISKNFLLKYPGMGATYLTWDGVGNLYFSQNLNQQIQQLDTKTREKSLFLKNSFQIDFGGN